MWREEANKSVDLDVLPHHGGIFQGYSVSREFPYFKTSSPNKLTKYAHQIKHTKIVVLESKLEQARCLPSIAMD